VRNDQMVLGVPRQSTGVWVSMDLGYEAVNSSYLALIDEAIGDGPNARGDDDAAIFL